MLLRRFAPGFEKPNRGPIRGWTGARRVNFRLELLEDRFLLAGGAEGIISSPTSSVAQTGAAQMDTGTPVSGASAQSAQESNAPKAMSEAGTHAAETTANAGSSVSDQQQSNAANSTDQDPLQDYSPALAQTGSMCASTAGSGSVANAPCNAGSSVTASSSGAGSAAPTPTSSTQATNGFFPGQAPSISIPLPIPPGVPAGGVFRQIAALSAPASLTAISPDPVAVDSLAYTSPPLATSGSMTAVHAAQPSFIAAQAQSNNLRSSLVPAFARSKLARARTHSPTETAPRPRGQHVVLPDVTALAAAAFSKATVDDKSLAHAPIALADSGAKPLAEPQELVALARPAFVAWQTDPGEDPEVETDRHKIPADAAIYSAASLALGLTTPGLTTIMQRFKKRTIRRRLRRNANISRS